MSMENPTNPQFRELSYQERLNAQELAEMEAQLAGTDPAVLDEVLGSAKVFDPARDGCTRTQARTRTNTGTYP